MNIVYKFIPKGSLNLQLAKGQNMSILILWISQKHLLKFLHGYL